MPWSVSIINRYLIRKFRIVKCQILLVLRGRISRGFIRTPLRRPLPPWLPGRAVAQSPDPLPALSSDALRPDRAQRASVLGNLDRGWLAAGIDNLRPAPLGNLAGCCLAALAGKAKPTAT